MGLAVVERLDLVEYGDRDNPRFFGNVATDHENDTEFTQRHEQFQLRVRDLHKSFGKHHVLRGIDLDIERHKINIIIGGSGQSSCRSS